MGAPAPNQTMALISNSSGYYDPRYWDKQNAYEQELRYRQEMERQRAMQHIAYDINTDTYGGMSAQQMQEAKQVQEQKPSKAAQPAYLTNDKLLLLGEAS